MAVPVLLVLLCLPAVVESQCAVVDFQTQNNFDADRFQGRWYIWKQFTEAALPEDAYENREHIYTTNKGGGFQTLSIGRDQANVCRFGHGKLEMEVQEGGYSARLKYQPSLAVDVSVDYRVIDTDYDHYAVIYGCNRVDEATGRCQSAFSWILDRNPEPCLSTAILNKINQTVSGLCLMDSDFKVVYQVGERCRQCDQATWTVQPNFQLDKYLGAWHEIVFQPGVVFPPEMQLHNYVHVYSDLSNGSVAVRLVGSDPAQGDKCFIRDKMLSLDKTNTPGKFLFYKSPDRSVFPGDDYWVIETDYTGYAFVLGCVREPTTPVGTCEGYSSLVWSRRPYLTGKQFIRIKDLMDRYCINENIFVRIHDKTCAIDPSEREMVQVCVKYLKSDVSFMESW